MILVEYPNCSTCKKAKKFLEDNKCVFEDRNIVINNPSKDEIKEWLSKSDVDINKFFNTSGLKYRELNLKDKIKNMSLKEKIELLSTDGMLIKRPILITKNKVLVGFKNTEWNKIL